MFAAHSAAVFADAQKHTSLCSSPVYTHPRTAQWGHTRLPGIERKGIKDAPNMQSQGGSGILSEGEKALRTLALRRCRAVPWTRSCPNLNSKLSGILFPAAAKGGLYVRFPIYWAARLPKALHERLRSFFSFRDLSDSFHISFGKFRWTTPRAK